MSEWQKTREEKRAEGEKGEAKEGQRGRGLTGLKDKTTHVPIVVLGEIRLFRHDGLNRDPGRGRKKRKGKERGGSGG